MQVSDIFKVLADFVEFARAILAGRGLEPYARKGVVDPQLVAFCVTGVALAYLMTAAKKFPGYERQGVQQPGNTARSRGLLRKAIKSDKQQLGSDMLLFIVFLLPGAAVMHPILVMVNGWFGGGELGTVGDTINAGLAYGAVWHPTRALLLRAEAALRSGIRKKSVRSTVGGFLLVASTLAQLAFLFYWITALAAVHSQDRSAMFWVGATASAVFFVGLLLGAACIFRLDDDEDADGQVPSPPAPAAKAVTS